MPMSILGTGSITGLSAGGLPDATVTTADIVDANVTTAKVADANITTAKVADANITAEKLSGAQSGAAPVYGCRAWVNFAGATGAIRASGNVTSVTRNGTGDYTINFTTALPDANYAIMGMTQIDTGGAVQCGEIGIKRSAGALTSSSARITTNNGAQTAVDVAIATVSFIR